MSDERLDTLWRNGFRVIHMAWELVGLEEAAQFQLAIGAHNGIGIDLKIHGKLAHGG